MYNFIMGYIILSLLLSSLFLLVVAVVVKLNSTVLKADLVSDNWLLIGWK